MNKALDPFCGHGGLIDAIDLRMMRLYGVNETISSLMCAFSVRLQRF